ncbi:MAG: tetratricopeptide repeat protein [Vicinamibacterales bacterium]
MRRTSRAGTSGKGGRGTRLDYNYLPPREAFALADRALLDALRLDNTLAEPHASLGHLRLHQFNWSAAARHFTHAIELNPGYDTAHYYYANLLVALGRFDEALVEANRALELDPMSATARQNRVSVLHMARRYEEAAEEMTETIRMDSAYAGLYYTLGQNYERQGKYAEAIAAFQKLNPKSDSRGATVRAAIGYAHARAGQRDAAIDVLGQLEELSSREYVSLYDLALLHLAIGDKDRAFEKVSQAIDEYASFLPFLNIDARFDEVRTDPRFRALVERMRLPMH